MKAQKKKEKGLLLPVFIGILTGIFLKLFVFDIQKVSGTSMEPVIHDNSTIVLLKTAYGIPVPFGNSLLVQWKTPEKGDIIYYFYKNKPVIKRCVATEFEPLEFSSDSGYSLTVGGLTIPLTEQQYQRIKYNTFVPEGTVLAIGDNYAESVDSRDYGFITVRSIQGKVACR